MLYFEAPVGVTVNSPGVAPAVSAARATDAVAIPNMTSAVLSEFRTVLKALVCSSCFPAAFLDCDTILSLLFRFFVLSVARNLACFRPGFRVLRESLRADTGNQLQHAEPKVQRIPSGHRLPGCCRPVAKLGTIPAIPGGTAIGML